MNLKMSKIVVAFLIATPVAVCLFLGIGHVKAANSIVEICVKKSGFVYVVGEGFRRNDCTKSDKLITINTEGIQGPKGDTGATGPMGPQGPSGTQSWNEERIVALEARVTALENPQIADCSASTICGSACSYGGVNYNTVLIGSQCWFKENLNVGTMLANTETPDNVVPTLNDPSTVSKWCFNDSSASCTSEGGLYTWSEANILPNSCNTTYCDVSTPNQGICPAGWRIPSDAEFYTLENYLKTSGQTCDATRLGWDCSDAGTKLIFGGSSGFNALGAGNHETAGAGSFFDKREPSVHFWSSVPMSPLDANGTYAWLRTLVSSVGGGGGSETILRGGYLKAFGFSVRCVR
jgi:uncharacterized protein (TIGR02145 family)